jgi:hypothetical protein
VDGKWTTDHTAPQENDGHNNINNILKPDDIKKHHSDAAAGVIAGGAGGAAAGGVGAALLSSAHPDSTSAKLAGEVPKESEKPGPTVEESSTTAALPLERKTSPPGAFPETPANEPDSFSVNPIPASSGAVNPIAVPAGEKLPDHQGVTGNTIDSKVTTSKEDYEKDASSALPEEKSYGVDPIPASSGAGNPVSVPAGEKLPDHEGVTGNTVASNATTSKQDYEKDASSPFPEEKSYGVDPIPASAGMSNPVSVPAGESVEQHKSFLPTSIYANATTSKEDYDKAGSAAMPVGAAGDGVAEPNDSAFSVPDRTKDMIPESSLPMSGDAKDTTDMGPFIQSSGPGTTTAALAGQVPLEPKSKATVVDDETPSETGRFTQSSGPGTTTAALAGQVPLESKSKATVMDDATPANTGPLTQSSGPGTTTAALAGQVPLEPKSKATIMDDETPSATLTGPAPDVPEVVKESLSQAHEPPEAAASSAAVEEKKEVERELLREVKATDATGEPAPTAAAAAAAAATSATVPSTTAADSKTLEHATEGDKTAEHDREPPRDISPLGKDPISTAPAPSSPVVTTGVGESKTSTISTPKKPTTPASSAASSPATTNDGKDKKKKRKSIFGKFKDILKG